MTVLLDVFDSGNPPWRPFVFPCDIPMQTVRIVKIRTHTNAGRHSCRNRNTIVVGGGESSLQSSQFDVQKRNVIVEQSDPVERRHTPGYAGRRNSVPRRSRWIAERRTR